MPIWQVNTTNISYEIELAIIGRMLMTFGDTFGDSMRDEYILPISVVSGIPKKLRFSSDFWQIFKFPRKHGTI